MKKVVRLQDVSTDFHDMKIIEKNLYKINTSYFIILYKINTTLLFWIK